MTPSLHQGTTALPVRNFQAGAVAAFPGLAPGPDPDYRARVKPQDDPGNKEAIKRTDPVRGMSPRVRAEYMARLPAFITYPRTGSQWLEAVMEKYFDRPCMRERRATLIDAKRTDWLFFHDHDTDLSLHHENALYLYRSPVETVYSYLNYRFAASRRNSWWGRWRQRGEQPITEEKVRGFSAEYRAHLEKWLLSGQRARTYVRYELLQSTPETEFPRICAHFELPFDHARMESAFREASREKMVEVAVKKKALSPALLSKDYTMGRRQFMQTYGDLVRSIVMTPELTPLFDYLDDQ